MQGTRFHRCRLSETGFCLCNDLLLLQAVEQEERKGRTICEHNDKI